jgi:hypothetical protein
MRYSQMIAEPIQSRKGPKLIRFTVIYLACFANMFLLAGSASAQDYYFEREPKKIALVIGNRSYTHLPPIESSHDDAEAITQRLQALGFDVSCYIDVSTLDQFQNEILQNFRKKINVGDLVLFYFSGHGFSYGPHNFLAPTEMPLSIPEARVTRYAISVDALEGLIASHSPGLLMFFIDACRSVSGLIIKTESNQNAVGKGPMAQEDPNSGVNSLIYYATKGGFPAIGYDEPGKLSRFTQSVSDYIGTEGEPFNQVFNIIAAQVKAATNEAQIPGIYNWSQTDPYMKPTERNLEDERELWYSVVHQGLVENIQVFLYRFSVSRYAAACRKWLSDNLNRSQATTYPSISVSPIAILRAWQTEGENAKSVRRLALPFAFFTSIENTSEDEFNTLSDYEVGLVAPRTSRKKLEAYDVVTDYFEGVSFHSQSGGPVPPDALPALYRNSLGFSLASIEAHGVVLVQQPLVAFQNPDPSAKPLETVLPGTQVHIEGLELGNGFWVRATSSDNLNPFYFKIESQKTPDILELGKSLKEIVVPPRKDSIPGLVDPVPIRRTIADLKASGWTITWASLSSGGASDKLEEENRAERIANAAYILNLSGVDSTRITSISGVGTSTERGVTVRFFGISKSGGQ